MADDLICAAIDVGTNSIHMVVARVFSNGSFEVITAEKEMVRLGDGLNAVGDLSDESIERAVQCLMRMATVASVHAAEVVAVATSAVREAGNRDEFIDRVKDETEISVQVISGFEEARLIHLGVLQGLPLIDERLLMIDIGGGSTEFLVGKGVEVITARSIKLGAIRLTSLFFPDGEASAKAVKKCAKFVRNALVATRHELVETGYKTVIGSSGTIVSIAAIVAANRTGDKKNADSSTFTAVELNELVETFKNTSTKERLNVAGLEERRADIIVAGAILLHEIFRTFNVDEMSVSSFALREGLLVDRAVPKGHTNKRLTVLRRSNVERLAAQLDPDVEHARQASKLALQLFDETQKLHGLGRDDRELLEMAALIHNVGLNISHASHHKHSYYIVRNSDRLTGFTERELEILALISRYHRKSHPNPKHSGFAQLKRRDQKVVELLSGLLRIGIGLDRSHNQAVESITTEYQKPSKTLRITAVANEGADLDLEIYSAQQRTDLLEKGLGVSIDVT